jgi:hypothetical protein
MNPANINGQQLHLQKLTQSHMFQDNDNRKNNNFQRTAISANIQNNQISNIFFSQDNIDALQQGIRYLVYKNNGTVISNQSVTELQIVMRGTYLEHSKNLQYDILKQIKDLNQKVLDYVVPRIIAEIKQYLYYIKDTSSQPVPLERSQNMSSAGTKFLYTEKL